MVSRHAGRRGQSVESMQKEYDFSKARRGAVAKTKGKTRITIYLDDDVIEAFRQKSDKAGKGYQTLINEALRESLSRVAAPVNARTLRRILREELERSRQEA